MATLKIGFQPPPSSLPGSIPGQLSQRVPLLTVLPGSRPKIRKKKVLIVNCYFDELRLPVRRSHKIPQAMAPAYLAGAFSPDLCEVRLYSELASGPLTDPVWFAWPDMLVLTGLTTSLDRMRHLAAYVRTKNPRAIVVAGGPPIRVLPNFSRRFFDYCCTGDVEQLQDVVADAFGPDYLAAEMLPRFDLTPWLGRNVGYAETTRNCIFHCSFCSMTGEGRKYAKYPLDYIRKQIVAAGPKKILVFLDNNFYGNDQKYFQARLHLIEDLRQQGFFEGWAALVASDFFLKSHNLRLARQAGCLSLFTGLETFDMDWLRRYHKDQNTLIPPVDMIRSCHEAGLIFSYGMMLDPFTRSLTDLRRELKFLIDAVDIPLPHYLSIPVPFPGTPFFYDCVARRAFLPLTKLRDLDGTTITLKPLDPLGDVAAFVKESQSPRGFRQHAIRHCDWFWRRYGAKLNCNQLLIILGSAAHFLNYLGVTAPKSFLLSGRHQRTYVSTTDFLDEVYTPIIPLSARYAYYFKPAMLTDREGNLSEDMQELWDRRPSAQENVPIANLG
jgi:hopanoid C-2 methylase